MYPIGEMAYDSYQNNKSYKQAAKEKELLLDTKDFDWITVENTKINYPVAWKENNNFYYLSHDIYDNENSHGAIFYEGSREPFSSHATILYGHCMRDKSMFATLHYLKEDEQRFRDSSMTIECKDGSVRKYKPLGLYVTNNDFYYSKLHKLTIDECVQKINDTSMYNIDAEYNKDSDIIVLMTCSYENKGDRLFVFYISE